MTQIYSSALEKIEKENIFFIFSHLGPSQISKHDHYDKNQYSKRNKTWIYIQVSNSEYSAVNFQFIYKGYTCLQSVNPLWMGYVACSNQGPNLCVWYGGLSKKQRFHKSLVKQTLDFT